MFDYDQIQVEVGSPLTPPTATKRAIILGKQGEDGNQVVFHIEAFEKVYGDGVCRLIALRPTEDFIYPPNYVTEVTDSGYIDPVTGHRELTWNISAYDTALYGYGRVEIQYLPYKTHLDIDPTTGDQKIQYWDTVDKEWVDREDCFDEFGKVRDEYKGLLGTNKFKSVTYPTQIFESFVEGEPPEDAAAWIDEILKLKTEVEVLVEEVKDFSEILKGIDDSFHSEHPGEEATEEHIFNWLKDKWATLDSKQDKLVDGGDTPNIKKIRVNEGTPSQKVFSLIDNVEEEPIIDLEIASDSYYLQQDSSNHHIIRLMKKPLKGEPSIVTTITVPDENTTYQLAGFTKSEKGKYSIKLLGSDGSVYPATLNINEDIRGLEDDIKAIYDIQEGTSKETGVLMDKVKELREDLVAKDNAEIKLDGKTFSYDTTSNQWDLDPIEHPITDVRVDGVPVVDNKIAKIDLTKKADKTYADEIKAEADKNKDDITNIKKVIPFTASATNQLTTTDFVNSSIEKSTAKFVGTFDTVQELYNTYGDQNDYGFVKVPDGHGGYHYDKYTHLDTPGSGQDKWKFEYRVNSTSFTDKQWKAINSGANETNIGQIDVNKGNIEILNTLLTKEISDRQQGDISVTNTLNTKIDNAIATEKARAEGKEADLQTQVDNKLDGTHTIRINKVEKRLVDDPKFDEYVTDIFLRHNGANGEIEESVVSPTTTSGVRDARLSTDQILQYIKINDVYYDSTYNGWKLSMGYVIPSNEPPSAEKRLPDIYCWYNGDASPVLHGTMTPKEGAKTGFTYLIPTKLTRPWLGTPPEKPYADWNCDLDIVQYVECVAKFDPNTNRYIWVEVGANIGNGGGGDSPNIKFLQLSDKHDALKVPITAGEDKTAHFGMTFTNGKDDEDLDSGYLELKFFDVVPTP